MNRSIKQFYSFNLSRFRCITRTNCYTAIRLTLHPEIVIDFVCASYTLKKLSTIVPASHYRCRRRRFFIQIKNGVINLHWESVIFEANSNRTYFLQCIHYNNVKIYILPYKQSFSVYIF